jgi:hypothetical protein
MAKWPQSWHWNWKEIASNAEGLLAYRYFGVVARNVTQGLMRVDLTKTCRVAAQAGKPLVYVDLVEAAPWNQPNSNDVSRLRGVGTALISAAVELSFQEKLEGRIGLHSLHQADEFYRDKCGMTELGFDHSYGGLRYFEMTSTQAHAFLE